MGLRGPFGGPLPRLVGQQSGRHEPARSVRQLHPADQRVFSAAGHPRFAARSCLWPVHTMPNVGGSLVLFDPARVRAGSADGRGSLRVARAADAGSLLSRDLGGLARRASTTARGRCRRIIYLVAFSFDPLPGMGSGVRRDSETGIYYFDRFGNLELLYREPGSAAMHPMPLARRAPPPPVIPSTLEASLDRRGRVRPGRCELEPAAAARGAADATNCGSSRCCRRRRRTWRTGRGIGYANAESARMLLGTVPVEPDGSAYFRRRPASRCTSRRWTQQGHAVQSMRSVTYLQPGERRGCVGCHEAAGHGAAARAAAGHQRPRIQHPAGARWHAAAELPAAGAACARSPLRGLPCGWQPVPGQPLGADGRAYGRLYAGVRQPAALRALVRMGRPDHRRDGHASRPLRRGRKPTSAHSGRCEPPTSSRHVARRPGPSEYLAGQQRAVLRHLPPDAQAQQITGGSVPPPELQ